MLTYVTQATTTRHRFENFHARLLGQFIHSRQMSQLRAECYQRVKFEGVPFATYVQSIKDTALLLRTRKNETQVVERIVKVLALIKRDRFVFQAPTSFRQFEKLVMVDRNIAYADQSRTARSAYVMIGAIESPPEPENPKYSHARTSQSPRSGKAAVCYYCQKTGHIQTRFFLRLS